LLPFSFPPGTRRCIWGFDLGEKHEAEVHELEKRETEEDEAEKNDIRAKNNSRSPLISTFAQYEETISNLFESLVTAILHCPSKTAHPVAEDAFHSMKSEVIPHRCNRLFSFIIRAQLAVL
jgi:hypothetical protein